jgi:hypothetical protein
MSLGSETFDELEKRARKCRRYERMVDFLSDYGFLIVLLPLLLAIVYAGHMGREPPLPALEAIFWLGIGFAIQLISMYVFSNKMRMYKLDDDEWAKFYTHSILNNLEKYFKAKTTGLKKDYRKKAVKNAKDFLSCIEKNGKLVVLNQLKHMLEMQFQILRRTLSIELFSVLKWVMMNYYEKSEELCTIFFIIQQSLQLNKSTF